MPIDEAIMPITSNHLLMAVLSLVKTDEFLRAFCDTDIVSAGDNPAGKPTYHS
jgi:hypothetical protein